MFVEDFEGKVLVHSEGDLTERLRLVRYGVYGAFTLWHENGASSLWLATNRDVAYVHFFPAKGHAGYQPTGMTPPGCPKQVHLLQIGAVEADSFDLPSETLVSCDAAFEAARAYFQAPGLPSCIRWLEL